MISVGGTSVGDHGVDITNNYSVAEYVGWLGWGYDEMLISNGIDNDALPDLNEWYHIVFIRDTFTYKLYINGDMIIETPTNNYLPSYGVEPEANIACWIPNRQVFKVQSMM